MPRILLALFFLAGCSQVSHTPPKQPEPIQQITILTDYGFVCGYVVAEEDRGLVISAPPAVVVIPWASIKFVMYGVGCQATSTEPAEKPMTIDVKAH